MGQTASAPAASSLLPANHPNVSSSAATPPPECPMHAKDANPNTPYAPAPAPLASKPAECPIQHDSKSSSPSVLNPLNQMPELNQERADGQALDLPTERSLSSIRRPSTSTSTTNPYANSPAFMSPHQGQTGAEGAASSGSASDETVWEYPSPQQFYNALVRKGYETPEDSVEVMVEIHNFLNEMAWREVLKWEEGYPGGENAILARFQGRPGTLSPKARMHLWAGKIFPSKFNTEPPFDRHDWVVHRQSPTDPTGPATETRYVIDYYSAPPDEEGNPVFYLDVRPSLDTVGSISQRIWAAASGKFKTQ